MEKGEWALVTGASSGIGRAFAERLAERGINLLLIALEEDLLSQFARNWHQSYHIQAIWYPLDLADPMSIEKIRKQIESKNLQISVLVNAAGFGYFGDFSSMPPKQIDRMIQVNVTSLVQLCGFLLPQMQGRGRGTIINIASISGFLPYPYAAVYAAGKSFVHGFTRAIWAENDNRKVKIISLCPGYTKTNFENTSNEPSGIHLFPAEDPFEMAGKVLKKISGNRRTIFTNITHPFKICFARLLPLKIFARLLKHLCGMQR